MSTQKISIGSMSLLDQNTKTNWKNGMSDCSKMRKFYFAILSEVGIHYNLNHEDIHDLLKIGYKIKTTSNLNYDEWYEYLDNIIYFVMVVFNMSFDSEGYKKDWISRVWLYWSMKPDNFYLLF